MPSSDQLSARACTRAYMLDDLHIRSDGSNRVVEAYAAVFSQRAEIMDQDGHYEEELAKTSFNRTIKNRHQPPKPSQFQVLFNHGADISGRASGELTIPIGVPLEVAADEKGVFTATRYIDNPLADSVFRAIKAKALRGMSFTGRFVHSMRSRTNTTGRGLPLIVRNEVDMREYGPTVFPAYEGADILGTRFATMLLAQPPDSRLEWLRTFEGQFEGFGTLNSDSPVFPSFGTPDGPADNRQAREAMRARIRQWRERSART